MNVYEQYPHPLLFCKVVNVECKKICDMSLDVKLSQFSGDQSVREP